jgi:hypothetical protein
LDFRTDSVGLVHIPTEFYEIAVLADSKGELVDFTTKRGNGEDVGSIVIHGNQTTNLKIWINMSSRDSTAICPRHRQRHLHSGRRGGGSSKGTTVMDPVGVGKQYTDDTSDKVRAGRYAHYGHLGVKYRVTVGTTCLSLAVVDDPV